MIPYYAWRLDGEFLQNSKETNEVCRDKVGCVSVGSYFK